MNRGEAEALLQVAVGDPDAHFRPDQWEAIERLVVQRKNLLVVERTGWGKSIVYFLTTRILRNSGAGPTVVVSPLLALMRNQVDAAHRLGLSAATINSTNVADWTAIKASILADDTDVLLLSPERLANEAFVLDVLLPIADRVGLLVVDEAHCISDWGHDFRPDYRRLVNILRQMPPNMPVLGTTATANDRVVIDVQQQLGDVETIRGPLTRDSLSLQTIRLPDPAARLAWLAEQVSQLEGTGIIYVLTRRDAEQVSGWLQRNGIDALPYYSDVGHSDFPDSHSYRLHLEESLLRNDLKALVATTALGMGYDKPDLSFVIHYQAPGSIVSYYQQVGRAGRAIPSAIGILLSGREDEDIHDFFRRSAFPDEKHVHIILDALEDSDGMRTVQLENHVNLTRGQIDKVLKYTSVENPAPVVKVGSRWQRTAVLFTMDHDHIDRLTNQREREWREVQDYIDCESCLMAHLGRVLDDPTTEPCGRCAICIGEPILPTEFERKTGIQAAAFLRRSEFPLQCKKQVARDAFLTYGLTGNLPDELRAEEGRVLSWWGDAGWGHVVATEKHAGAFSDDLVVATAEMITQRWAPDPPPMWVTCVPSLRHPNLVADFAKRLADVLSLEFLDVVKKVVENEPQKLQQNRYHQCRNLDGVFEVDDNVQNAPVILVDDVIDSSWTLTVIAALLRSSGSGPVFPLALASTSTGG